MAAAVFFIKMSAASLMRRALCKQVFDFSTKNVLVPCQVQPKRHRWNLMVLPEPGVNGKSYRRIVHYKDEYTVEPLNVTNLGGRDPETGRVVAKGIGGGIKHKFHWIKWIRDGPSDLNVPPKEEKVLEIFKDGCRTSFVALVGAGRELKYILAAENLKVGDIIRTHKGITRNPVRAFEGDAYPLGALPMGTKVHCVEKYPGVGGFLVHAAGTFGTLIRRDKNDNVIVKMPSKKLFSLPPECMATVGQLSNVDHGNTPIGSAQKNRELGNRPRSGLWKRKTGLCGRKIKNYNKIINVGGKERNSSASLILPLNMSTLNE